MYNRYRSLLPRRKGSDLVAESVSHAADPIRGNSHP